MQTQFNLNYAYTQSFENQAINIALAEFYSFSEKQLEDFLLCLNNNYSDKTAQLIRENHEKWLSNVSTPAYEIRKKILACMPKFADENTRFELLKLEFLYFLSSLEKEYYDNNNRYINNIKDFYKAVFNEVKKLDDYDIQWFTKTAYSKDEIFDLAIAMQYILENILIESYQNVYDDLKYLVPQITYFNSIIYKALFNPIDEEEDEMKIFKWANYSIHICSLIVDFYFIDVPFSLLPSLSKSKFNKPIYPELSNSSLKSQIQSFIENGYLTIFVNLVRNG